MTRINAGIDPRELCDKHLRSEYRELPRVWNDAWRYAGKPAPGPKTFKLNAGHVLFFVSRGAYLRRRWARIVEEMRYRGFSPRFGWRPWPPEHEGEWTSTPEARELLQERICERLATMRPRWTRRQPPAWAIESKAA